MSLRLQASSYRTDVVSYRGGCQVGDGQICVIVPDDGADAAVNVAPDHDDVTLVFVGCLPVEGEVEQPHKVLVIVRPVVLQEVDL